MIQQVSKAVEAVGQFIANERKTFSKDKIQQKGELDFVSYVDIEAEKRLVENLTKILPEAGIIGEESTSVQGSLSGLNWVIDPLDGTINFLHDIPYYAISVALVDNHQPILGVVNHVSLNDIYTAETGKGAFCNGQRIKVSPDKNWADALISNGMPNRNFDGYERHYEVLKTIMPQSHGWRRFGAAAIDLSFVACGKLNGFFCNQLKSWDMAAGICLIQEAGGIITDYAGGNQMLTTGQVVAGGGIQPKLLELIQSFEN